MSLDYQNAVLADSPLVYYRHDEVGSASNNDTIPDSSGNGRDATLCLSALSPYGRASAIETDNLSSALWTFSDNTSHVGGPHSFAWNTSTALNLTGNFILECWVKSNSDVILGTSFPFFGKRGRFRLRRKFRASGVGVGEANFYWEVAVVLSDGETYTAVAEVPVTNGLFYYLVGGKVGNSLFLRVNTILRAQTTVPGLAVATPSSAALSLTPCTPPGDALFIGGLPFNDIHNDVDLDECAVYESLSESRIIAHYEAALNSLNMSGRCDIRITASLNGDTEPDPEPFDFRHNWESPFVERLSARSSVFKSKNGTAQMAAQRSGVRRELDYNCLLHTEQMWRRFIAKCQAAQSYRWHVPVRPYEVRVDIPAGSTSASFDTAYLDFDAGNHAMAWSLDYTSSRVVEITEVTANGVEWDEPLDDDYYYLTPARRGYIPPALNARGHTAVIGELDITARLLPEDEPLSPNRVTPWTPTATYQGYEIFRPQDWQSNDYSDPVDIELLRDTDLTDFETGVFHQRADTPGTEGVRSYRMLLDGKEAISRFLGWWYYRTGRTVPFWQPSFQSDFDPVSLVGSALTVSGHLYTDYYNLADARKDIVFVYNDDTIAYRRIGAASKSGSNDVLTLSGGSGTLSLSNLRYICFLKLGILGADLLEIAWETDSVARVVFTFSELLTTPEVPAASASISPSASVSPSVSRSVSPSASLSPSSSASPSSSVSASASLSLSPSASASPSASESPSPSRSASPSASQSPSSSTSPSGSVSPSSSSSLSVSPSASASPSA